MCLAAPTVIGIQKTDNCRQNKVIITEAVPGRIGGCLPTELNVFVDTGGDAHGDYSVVPGADKHEGQTQTHAQERQGPERDAKISRRIIYLPVDLLTSQT